MHKFFYKKSTVIILTILFFLISLILGNTIILHLFLNYQQKEYKYVANHLATEYAEGLPCKTERNVVLKFYDFNNNIFTESTSMPNDAVNLDNIIKKYGEKLLEKKTIACLSKVIGLNADSVIIGVPVLKDSKVIGALFVLSPADEFEATTNTFLLLYSLTVAVGTLINILYFRIFVAKSKELEQTRKDYIANVSHELKSPISSIKALTETLADNMIQDFQTQKKYYNIILSESNHLEKLIFDMLELSKIQSGKLDFSKNNVTAENILMPIFQKYSILCDEMDIEFITECDFKNIPELETNPERLKQLLEILLNNAVKFVGTDGRIIIRILIQSKVIVFEVNDNGIGINEDILPNIFERFIKEDVSHNSKGSGLGLAIAKEIILGLGEKIWVKSNVNEGSSFYFTIKHL